MRVTVAGGGILSTATSPSIRSPRGGTCSCCVQRLHDGLAIGDRHEYDEPFSSDVRETPYAYLVDVVEEFPGRALPPVRQRWAVVYSQCRDPHQIGGRAQRDNGVWVIAEQTAVLIAL